MRQDNILEGLSVQFGYKELITLMGMHYRPPVVEYSWKIIALLILTRSPTVQRA